MASRFSDEYRSFYEAFSEQFLARDDVAADPDNDPPRWFVRPGEVVVHKAELDELGSRLEGAGFQPVRPFGYGPANELETRVPLPFAVYKNPQLGRDPGDVVQLRNAVAQLRDGDDMRRVGMNHLVGASPWIWVS